jgi:hypothetical protein
MSNSGGNDFGVVTRNTCPRNSEHGVEIRKSDRAERKISKNNDSRGGKPISRPSPTPGNHNAPQTRKNLEGRGWGWVSSR